MSPKELPFEKWEGLGNDFVIVEAAAWPDGEAGAELARALCDRRRGIGADGVLVVDAAEPRMTVLNADGSRPEMCGNGLRCVAAWLGARGARDARFAEGRFAVETDAGTKSCSVVAAGRDRWDVTVDMGSARIGGELEIEDGPVLRRFRSVDVGNPHAITFEPWSEADVDRVGPRVMRLPEGGTNVEFCTIREATRPVIDVVVWERGAGRTLACGTGACAVAALACELGRAAFDAPIEVVLPGGPLEITVAARTLRLTMKGPARRVFAGIIPSPERPPGPASVD